MLHPNSKDSGSISTSISTDTIKGITPTTRLNGYWKMISVIIVEKKISFNEKKNVAWENLL
jgi:hypothetical protein